ncbi:hypothetical protein GDO78_001693 [Eleutherodactylus coqui]|uniref:Secreted protein n=1 Tax=Eleutherodactylus coqui TaxID=57060 RepID=A0A8J6FSQ5_ELECQ|nr:hypothetical protein GDO78_001693 [Eleutherodactylus coqui]
MDFLLGLHLVGIYILSLSLFCPLRDAVPFTHDLSDIISSAHSSHFLAHSLHVWTALETLWKPLLSRLTAASSVCDNFYLMSYS